MECPTRDEIRDCLSGRLSMLRSESVLQHLEACKTCVTFSVGRETSSDKLTQRLKGVPPAPTYSTEGLAAAIMRGKNHHLPHAAARSSKLDVEAETDDWQPNESTDVESEPSRPLAIGKYSIVRTLGHGGFGTVYLARDNDLGRLVAIKVPRLDRLGDPDAFLEEARIVARLDHPHIVPIFDVSRTDDGIHFLVEKFIDGEPLSRRAFRERLGFAEAADIVATIADALHYAHLHGIFHRDVKPDNILLDIGRRPYITDFGEALDDASFGSGPNYIGTPQYMSPEQARGESHLINGRSDVFSLGVVFYELLTGVRPFDHHAIPQILERIILVEPKPPRQIDDAIPFELERTCLKALSKRTAERYTTALDMAQDIRDWLRQPAAPENSANPIKILSHVESVEHAATIVPKGLHSFDEFDASFFLQLLPGPRDRNGLPDSLRFWKNRIEATGLDETFRIGLIYGPSGCGKSSLVKAGLLPVLSANIISIYLEATPDDTEDRLVTRIINRLRMEQIFLEARGLVELLHALRCGENNTSGRKVLLVIDQFEQWLQQRHDYTATELVRGLRQCDGRQLQCLLMVRDDFWMSTTRIMDDLDIVLASHNSAAVDLFDLSHARNVLLEFGRAYRRLPAGPASLHPGEDQFLNNAISELAEDGYVTPVRLSLFAEMMKHRDWTSKSLKDVGGTDGIGIRYLESILGESKAKPFYRTHQPAVRAVLTALLPTRGDTLKGTMRSFQELLDITGYSARERDLHLLMKNLAECRLITLGPIEVEIPTSNDDHSTTRPQQHFQLSHDYLVPSLHEWLAQKQRQTRRGRARLLLHERTQEWKHTQDRRSLPSLIQTLSIITFTNRQSRDVAQQKLLRTAILRHGRNCLALMMVFIAGAMAVVHSLPEVPGQAEYLQLFCDNSGSASLGERQAAFEHLDDLHVYRFLPQITNEVDLISGTDHPLALMVLDRMDHLLTEERSDGMPEQSGPIYEEILDLLERTTLSHKVNVVRAHAFRQLVRHKPVVAVLTLMPLLNREPSESELAKEIEVFLDNLDIAGLTPESRGPVLRELIFILHDKPQPHVAEACLKHLDQLPARRLFEYFIDAYRTTDVKTAATESLGVYARAAESNPERIDELGEYCEVQIASRLRPDVNGIVRPSFELEYFVHCIAEFYQYGNRSYERTLLLLDDVIVNRQSKTYSLLARESPSVTASSVLDRIVATFGTLNADIRIPTNALRDSLEDENSTWQVREHAATILGNLHDIDAIDLLIHLATVDDWRIHLNLRLRVVASLGKIGGWLRVSDHEQPLAEIARCLRMLLVDHETQVPLVLSEAVEAGFGQRLLADDDIELLFPLLLKDSISAETVRRIQQLLIEVPERSTKIVPSYVAWRASSSTPEIFASENPDHVLTSFGFFHAPKFDASITVAMRAITPELARIAVHSPKLGERQVAIQLLEQALPASMLDSMPKIDVRSSTVGRQSALTLWLNWWSTAALGLRFNDGHLFEVH